MAIITDIQVSGPDYLGYLQFNITTDTEPGYVVIYFAAAETGGSFFPNETTRIDATHWYALINPNTGPFGVTTTPIFYKGEADGTLTGEVELTYFPFPPAPEPVETTPLAPPVGSFASSSNGDVLLGTTGLSPALFSNTPDFKRPDDFIDNINREF